MKSCRFLFNSMSSFSRKNVYGGEVFDRGYFVHVLADNFGNGLSSFFPLYLSTVTEHLSLLDHGKSGRPKSNLSSEAAGYFSRLGASEQDLFYHILAVLHSPTYRTENAGALRQDWPRVPLPGAAELLRASAALGLQVAALLDTERPVPGVT